MSSDQKGIILFGILAAVLVTVHCGPRRVLTLENKFDDLLNEVKADEYNGGSDYYEENSPGVLNRLWTGFTNLDLFGTKKFEGKLNRFRSEVTSRVKAGVGEILGTRRRQKRAHPIEGILTKDTKGYYKLSELNTNVHQHLKNFASPRNAISMEVFEHQNFVFWLVTEEYSIENLGFIYIYMLDVGRNTIQRARISSFGAIKCVPVLKLDNLIEIVCVEALGHLAKQTTRKRVGSGVYRITWANGLRVGFERALPTLTAQDVAVWRLGGSTYISFANSYDPVKRTGEIKSILFRLQTTTLSGVTYSNYNKLDKASFGTKYAFGLEAFRIISRQFLAVANHKDDTGNVEVDSVIYVYDLQEEKLKQFQRIRTSAARDWTAFSFADGPSSEYFLAVANEYKIDKNGNKNYAIDSVIYKYDNGKFVPFQCIRTNGARQWVVYQSPKGEFVLGVVNGQSGVVFYQYNGWKFVQTRFRLSGVGVSFVNIAPLRNTLNQIVLSIANPFEVSIPQSYYITFEYSNPLGKYHDDALTWCKSFSNTVNNDGLADLFRRVQIATKVDEPKNFTTPITIRGNLIVTASFSHILNIIVLSSGVNVDLGLEDFEKLKADIDLALQRILNLRTRLQNAVSINNQTNMDGVRFTNARIVCSNGGVIGRCSVQNLISKTVNGASASFDGVLRLDGNNIANFNLADVLLSGGHLTVNFLSGPGVPRTPFSDFVTLTGNHIIFGRKTFGKLQANYLIVSGTVGGVRISKDDILLTVFEQRILGELSLDVLRATSITIGSLNGRDLNGFFNNLVLNGANQEFSGLLVINGDLVVPSITTINPVTPLDPVTASKTALLQNTGETQFITGSHVIKELHARQGIIVKGLVNGISVPDDLYLRSSNEIITRPVTFQDVAADMVTIDRMLGDIQVKNGELDLLLLKGDQVVTGRKSFQEITLLGHSNVDGTVAGYRIQDLTANLGAEFIRGLNTGRRIHGTVTFEGGLRILDDLVDGVSISRILNNGVRLDQSRIDNQIIFDGPVQVDGDLKITNTLNGVDIEDYVLKDGTHVFTGEISFTTDLVSRGNVETGKVNGYDVSELSSQLVLLDGAQTISGDLTLHNPEFRDISVSGEVLVNGINFNDLVTLNSDAVITGQKTFASVKVLSHVKAGAVDVGKFGTVDGVVISDLFFADSLRKSATTVQNLIGRNLNIVIAESVSGTNLANLERRIVYKDRPESIDGSLTFTGPVTVKDLTFNGNFDGVSADDYIGGWLLRTGVQTLTGHNYYFNLNATEVTFSGNFIQGTDLNLLLRNTVKIDESATLDRVSFDAVISMSPISLGGRIQGINLKEEALLANGVNQVVTGIKTFWQTIHFKGEFNIDGKVLVKSHQDDDALVYVDVGGLCTGIITDGKPTQIQEIIVDGDVFFGGNVNISASFNNLPVNTLRTTYWLSDVPNNVPGVTHFREVEIVPNANLLLEGLINGVDLSSLWDNILRKECDQQTVTGEFFIESLTVNRLETDTITNSGDQLGLNALNHVLFKDGDQDITGIFTLPKLETKDSVILEGTLNNLKVDTDFVQYGKNAVITAPKTFEYLTIQGDLSVEPSSTVQGVDVSELAKKTVKPDPGSGDSCFIPGTTTFKGLRFEDGSLEVGGTVDGVLLNSSRVLLKSVDQEVFGRLTLNGQTSLETLAELTVLDDRFNEISISRLRDFTVRNNRPNVIEAEITFLSSPTFTTITISNDLINGYNITDLALCLTGNHIVNNMGDQFSLVLGAAQDAKDMLAEKATELWYFKETRFSPVDRLIPVSLSDKLLVPHSYDALVGLDVKANLVYTYRIDRNFPQLYNPLPITMPLTAVGLSQNLLATCGKIGMADLGNGLTPTSDFRRIKLENGEDHGYGHIHSMSGEAGVVVAFGITHCKDLVSFRLPDNRLCLAVVDHAASSTVLCGTAASGFYLMNYLGTTRAVKGSWMYLQQKTYLIIVEHELDYAPGYMKVYSHDSISDEMVLVNKVELRGADDVDVMIHGTGAVIAVTMRANPNSNSSITIFTAYHEFNALIIETIQTIFVDDVHHCSLSLTPHGDIGLVVQTFFDIKIYFWKCVEFVYSRKIRTDGAVWPSSKAFLYNLHGYEYLMIPFCASGALDPLTKEHNIDVISTTLYHAVFRGNSQSQSISIY